MKPSEAKDNHNESQEVQRLKNPRHGGAGWIGGAASSKRTSGIPIIRSGVAAQAVTLELDVSSPLSPPTNCVGPEFDREREKQHPSSDDVAFG